MIGCSKRLSHSYNFLILILLCLAYPVKITLAQDWVITDTQIVENDAIILNGSLIVDNDGDLTLRGVALTVNNSYDGEFNIRIKSGGTITLEEGTTVTASSNSARFGFSVEPGAGILIKDSVISRCGWGPDSEDLGDNTTILSGIRGLVIDTINAVIQGSTFFDNHVGIILTGSEITLDNNNIHSNKVHGLYVHKASNCTIKNNSIHHSSISSPFRIVEAENNSIKTNTITLSEIHRGVIEAIYSHGNTFEDNTISGFGMGILMMFVSNNNLVKNNTISTDEAGIMVWGWNNIVQGNTIFADTMHPGTGIYMVYAYNSTIEGNTITGDVGDGIWLRHSSNNRIVENHIGAADDVELARTNGFLLMYSSRKNVIHGNTIAGFPRGISLFYSCDENIITGNEVSGSTLQTAIIEDASANQTHSNNFLDAGPFAYDSGQNQWNNGSQGNYWGRYNGVDTDEDGIGDAPHPINPEGNDNYPVMTPIDLDTVPVPEVEAASPPAPAELFDLTVTAEEVIENQSIVLGNIFVAAGGCLTLRNVDITTGASDRWSNIAVDASGSLSLYDCRIIHLDYGYGFGISPAEGSTFVMKDSELLGCGDEWPYGGIQIITDNFLFENNDISETILSFSNTSGGQIIDNRISKSFWTITLGDADDILISGNSISKSIDNVICGSGSNHTIKDNTITEFWGAGIGILEASGSIVEGNHISNAKAECPVITLKGPDTIIKENIISNCPMGIKTDQDTKTISRNTISNCSVGLDLRWANSLSEGNTISDCTVGIHILGSGHTVSGNMVKNCQSGLNLTMGSSDNTIYHNYFINNSVQAEDSWSNQWDYKNQGNYWSDYTGVDSDGDGIGDTSYFIASSGVDHYPLMQPIPLVTTSAISGITSNSATSDGIVISQGGSPILSNGICWSTSIDPTIGNNHSIEDTGFGSFSSTMFDLAPDTTYYVRAYATNSNGTGYGEDDMFTTLDTAPCPDCSGNIVFLENVTFTSDTICECDATSSMIIGPNVTIESNATVRINSKNVIVKSGVNVKRKADFKISQ